MIKIKNNIIPFKGYKAITLWPFLFYRSELSEVDINHENIHAEQQKEMGLIGFYLLYPLWKYENNPLEKEAYMNESNLNYLKTRKKYNWL